MRLSFTAAILVALSFAPARGQNKPVTAGKGSISGVVEKDGQAVANARVRLMLPRDRSSNSPAPVPRGKAALKGKAKREGGRGKPIAQTTTDNDGKFAFTDIPAGSYVVVAVQREARVGGRAMITVADGQALEVNVRVHPRAQRADRGRDRNDSGPTTNPSK